MATQKPGTQLQFILGPSDFVYREDGTRVWIPPRELHTAIDRVRGELLDQLTALADGQPRDLHALVERLAYVAAKATQFVALSAPRFELEQLGELPVIGRERLTGRLVVASGELPEGCDGLLELAAPSDDIEEKAH